MQSRRDIVFGLLTASTASLAGCVAGGRSPEAIDLDEWPPPERGDRLEFWSWEPYWGNQARAFKHVGDLESITRRMVPEHEQYRLLAGGETPDVLHFTSKQFERAIEEGLVQPLPVDLLPSWPIEDDLHVHGMDFYERDGEYYGIPQTPMIQSLAYNRHEFDEPDTWGLLWDDSLEGRISMPAEPTLAGQIAALYTGQDPNDPDDLDGVAEALAVQRPLLATYWEEWHDCWTMFNNDELLAAVLPYTPMCLCSHDESPVRRTAPREGVLYSQVAFAIPEGAANPHGALEFIDWGADFKTGTELTWDADRWTLHHNRALDTEVRESYESIADEIGIVPGPVE